jgi:hypothetical protein
MNDNEKYEQLVAEKRAAGLTKDQAETVAKDQIEWDREVGKQEAAKAKAEAAKAKKTEKEETAKQPTA